MKNWGLVEGQDVNIISINPHLVRVQFLKGLPKDVAKHIAELSAGVAKVTKTGQDPRTATEAELSEGDGVHVIIGERSMTLIEGQGRHSNKTKRVPPQTVEVPISQILKETVKEGRSPTFERVQQETATPESPAETVEVVSLAPRERVQQQIVEHVEDEPQSPPETIEAVAFLSREQVQQRIDEKIVKAPSSPAKKKSRW